MAEAPRPGSLPEPASDRLDAVTATSASAPAAHSSALAAPAR